jgi:transporter family-2 protein
MVALIGGLVGAAQVFAGLTLVNRVGGATFGVITVSVAS